MLEQRRCNRDIAAVQVINENGKREQEQHAREPDLVHCRFGSHSVTITVRQLRFADTLRQSGNANTQISKISSTNPLRIPYICRLQVESRVILRIGGYIY